jgi:hypothetical protein
MRIKYTHQCQSARSGGVTFTGYESDCIDYRASCGCDEVWHVVAVPDDGETNFARLDERMVSMADMASKPDSLWTRHAPECGAVVVAAHGVLRLAEFPAYLNGNRIPCIREVQDLCEWH